MVCLRWCSAKEPSCQYRRRGLDPLIRKIPWKRKWQPTPVFLLEESMDRGAWQVTVHGVTKSWTPLSDRAHTAHLFKNKILYIHCSLYHWTLLLPPDTSTTEHCFCFGTALSGTISPIFLIGIPLDTYEPGGLIFQCHIFLSFHTVLGVLKARMLCQLTYKFF